MNCPKCNKILDDGATYCMSCGIRVDDPEAN
ncbi:MAG: zinc-ribbon domain-containing protein, partial [Lachnospiraceae bacterium]|nr:zinc-ribbon domain-containing protein [Lachnospiraceae bacterium]